MNRMTDLGHRLADLPGGRRAKWVVLAVWLIVFMAMGPLAGKFEEVQENDPADYLPAEGGVGEGDRGAGGLPLGRHRRRDHGLQPRRWTGASGRGGDRGDPDRDQLERVRGGGRHPAADRLRRRQLRPSDHPDHGRGRHQRGGRGPRRRDRRDQGRHRGPARGARGQGHRARRVLGRRDRGLRADRRRAPLLDGAPRPDPADHHLPQPHLLADPLLRGDPGRAHFSRHGLPPRGGRRHRDRPDRRHPAGARVRCGDGLRLAPCVEIPRGAAQP